MANSKDCSFLPSPRILTCGGFSFLAILIAAMCLSPYVVADDVYQNQSMPNITETGNWTNHAYWSRSGSGTGDPYPTPGTNECFYVGHSANEKLVFRTKLLTTGVDTFQKNTLWMGYNMDRSLSAHQMELGLKCPKFEVNDLQLGNALVNFGSANVTTITLDGNMTVNGTTEKPVVFNTNGTGNEIVVASAISGAGVITLSESSNLTISHDNNAFTGTLTVSKNSTVRLDGSNALQNATSVFIDTGATLFVKAAQTFQNNVITGSGTLRVSVDSDTLTNAVSDEFTGIINIRNSKQLTYSKPLTSNYSLAIANDSQFRIFNQTQQTQLECDIRLTGEGRDILTNVKAGALVFQGLTETSTVKGKVTLFGDALIGAYGSVSMASFTNEIETNGYTLKFRQTRQAGTNNVATFSIESDVLSSSGTGTIQFVSDQSLSVNDTFLCFGDPSAADESAPTSQSINVNMINYNKNEIVFQPGENRTVTVSGNLATDSSGNKKGYIKNGDGTLVLNGGLAAPMTVNAGVFELAGSAIENVTGIITVNDGGTLEYNVASGDEKTAAFTNTAYVLGNGDILKTGEGRLKINTEGVTGDLHFTADNFVVASGRLDLQGYMLGSIEVDADTVFSPGNSVGEATFGGGYILKDGATLLIEQEGDRIDTLTASSFTIDSNSIIDIVADSLHPGASYDIIFQTDSEGNPKIFTEAQATDDFWNNLLTPESAYYWNLSVSGNIVRASVDANAVPEPSTWALLALGAAGLLYWRKRK